jgi:tetratricopeptide (TPR) repeat protein
VAGLDRPPSSLVHGNAYIKSIMKPHLFIIFFQFAFILCSPAATLSSESKNKDSKADQEKIRSEIDVASKLCDLIRFDRALYADYIEQVVALALDADLHDEAVSLADTVQTFKKGVLLGRCAASLARAGDKERARQLQDQAIAFAVQKGGWQFERITGATLASSYQLDGPNAALQALNSLTRPDEKLYALPGLAREYALDGLDYDFKDSHTYGLFMPEFVSVLEAMQHVAEIHFANDPERGPQRAAAIVDRALELTQEDQFPAAVALLEFGRSMQLRGAVKDAGRLYEAAARNVLKRQSGRHVRYMATAKAAAAMASVDHTKTPEAEKALRLAASSALKDLPEPLQPWVFCGLAEGWLLLENSDEAMAAYAKALGIGIGNPNKKVAVQAALDVLLSANKNSVDLPQELRDKVDEIKSSASEDLKP